MSVQALRGTDRVFADDLQALRPHPGQARSPPTCVALLAGSPIVADHLEDLTQVQDAYSLRCAPRCTAPRATPVAHARAVAERRARPPRSTIPCVLPDGALESNGNFHGAPVGYVLDFLAIAARRRRLDGGAPDRPDARPLAQLRAAAVPRASPGHRLGTDDRPVHPGGDRRPS